mgnify:CR=1 FL=1
MRLADRPRAFPRILRKRCLGDARSRLEARSERSYTDHFSENYEPSPPSPPLRARSRLTPQPFPPRGGRGQRALQGRPRALKAARRRRRAGGTMRRALGTLGCCLALLLPLLPAARGVPHRHRRQPLGSGLGRHGAAGTALLSRAAARSCPFPAALCPAAAPGGDACRSLRALLAAARPPLPWLPQGLAACLLL